MALRPKSRDNVGQALVSTTGKGDRRLAKPNYAFAKRQRELAKRQKKEEKLKRKAEQGGTAEAPDQDEPVVDDAEGKQPEDGEAPA